MRVHKAYYPVFGVATFGLVLALTGCKAEASARIGGGEAEAPPQPAPTQAASTPPPEAKPPMVRPKFRGIGKMKITGNKVQMPAEIEFEYNKSSIKDTPENKEILENLAQFLKENPNVTKLRIEGHTDDRGDHAYNMDLSEKRAQAVANWLISNGIDKERLVVKGYGETRPEVPNTSEENRQRNRRTEFHVQEIDGKPTDDQPN